MGVADRDILEVFNKLGNHSGWYGRDMKVEVCGNCGDSIWRVETPDLYRSIEVLRTWVLIMICSSETRSTVIVVGNRAVVQTVYAVAVSVQRIDARVVR